MFEAIVIEKDDAGYRARLGEVAAADLPEGDVTVAVEWSTLNYKDALAITGRSPVVRRFPMVPGPLGRPRRRGPRQGRLAAADP